MALLQFDSTGFGIVQPLLPAANIFGHCRNTLNARLAITAQLIMGGTSAHHCDPAGLNRQANVLHPRPRGGEICQTFSMSLRFTQLHARVARLLCVAFDSQCQRLHAPAGQIALRLSPRQCTSRIRHHPICGLAGLAGLLIGLGECLQLLNQSLMRRFCLAGLGLRLLQLRLQRLQAIALLKRQGRR